MVKASRRPAGVEWFNSTVKPVIFEIYIVLNTYGVVVMFWKYGSLITGLVYSRSLAMNQSFKAGT